MVLIISRHREVDNAGTNSFDFKKRDLRVPVIPVLGQQASRRLKVICRFVVSLSSAWNA